MMAPGLNPGPDRIDGTQENEKLFIRLHDRYMEGTLSVDEAERILSRICRSERLGTDFLLHGSSLTADRIMLWLYSWAAEKDDEEMADWVLGQMDEGGYVLGTPFILGDRPEWCRKNCFVTDKEKYLEKLFGRFGVSEDVMRSDAGDEPDHYAAISEGNLILTRFFLSRGAYGSGWYTRRNLPVGRENNVLIAALRSRNPDVLRLILDSFDELEWNDEIGQAIAGSSEECRRLLVQECPEIMGFMKPERIIRLRSEAFLREYMNYCSLDRLTGLKETGLFYPKVCCGRMRVAELNRFYRLAFSLCGDRMTKDILYRQLLTDFENRNGPARLWKLMIDNLDEEMDLLPSFLENIGGTWRINRELCHAVAKRRGREAIRFTADLYGAWDTPWTCEEGTVADIRMLLGMLRPLSLKPAADRLNVIILKKGKPELVGLAVEKGFISGVNAPALIREMAGFRGSKEINKVLMGLIRSERIDARYAD